jgi:hypothetical protein
VADSLLYLGKCLIVGVAVLLATAAVWGIVLAHVRAAKLLLATGPLTRDEARLVCGVCLFHAGACWAVAASHPLDEGTCSTAP